MMSNFGTKNTTSTVHTTSTTTQPHTTTSAGNSESAADKVKGLAAGVHGVGEKIRGTFNAGVDEFNPSEKGGSKTVNQSRNEAIAAQGDSEIHTGRFSENTKAKEGVRPGNGI